MRPLYLILPAALAIVAIGGMAKKPANAAPATSHATPLRGDAVAGKVVYDHWCATCHAEGHGHPAYFALKEKYHDSLPAVLDQRTDLTPEVIHYFLRNGVTIMPFFRKSEISTQDEANLIAYLTRPRPAPARAKRK